MNKLTPDSNTVSEQAADAFSQRSIPTIGKRIAWLRKKRGLTQVQLGELIGVNASNVTRWELGKQSPRQVSAGKLATALNTTSDWITRGVGPYEARKGRPVVGYVGATNVETSDKLYPIDDYEVGDAADFIEPPFKTPEDTVVAIIKGDSHYPFLKDGDAILYRRDVPFLMHDCINKLCVIKTDDDQVVIKILKQSRIVGAFKLESLNAPTQDGIHIVWASPILGIVYK